MAPRRERVQLLKAEFIVLYITVSERGLLGGMIISGGNFIAPRINM